MPLIRFPFLVLSVLCLMWTGVVGGQRLDMKVLGNYRQIEIPFDTENDFIVIPILLNNLIPLRFIVDTGAENTVLLDRTMTDLLEVNYMRTFQVRGSDLTEMLTAHLATGVNMRLADRLLARNRTILVLEENYFNFERITGTTIHGILGADFLMRFIVEFDFRRKVLILHDPSKFRLTRAFIEVPADFIRNRPYLYIDVGVLSGQSTRRKLLMDTGAGLSLLMHTYPDSNHIDLPQQTIPTYIASGLGGTLEGSVGRSRLVSMANREMNDVVTYFQEVDSINAGFVQQREGILGNQILRRFRIVVDYVNHKVYLRPEGGRWKRKFRFDRSGLNILAGGNNLRSFTISNVVPGSPADEAGIQVRDRIRAVNGVPVALLSLESIIRKLQRRPGKRIRMRVYRAGRLYDLEFRLRDLI
ncbi:PDZ domain-containing protein [Lewinella sp. IMCC34191]|uniref:PDZ domain-containing protein n=1 Tax=Lewinella sp. IMCC34191 TaxID=2259172 RepID=UPI000E2732B2|nr:PDZ domain-containing protein [Lewinella sp. IMCC34191]